MRVDEVTLENTYSEKKAKDTCLVSFRDLYNSSLIINGIVMLSYHLIFFKCITVPKQPLQLH